jgi:hypothetical protein
VSPLKRLTNADLVRRTCNLESPYPPNKSFIRNVPRPAMDITSISEPGPSKQPSLAPLKAPPMDEANEIQRSRSPPPSPHLPKQHLATPGLSGDSATMTNGKRGRSSSPSLLDAPATQGPGMQLPVAKSPSLCFSCAPNARQVAKYTCPRCGTKSCSVDCSRKHKESSGCSGELSGSSAFVECYADF